MLQRIIPRRALPRCVVRLPNRTLRMTATATKTIGLVLSGGGVRGVAHVGLLRALREKGIVPQLIAGTSAGAVAGALFAAGHSPGAMLDFFKELEPTDMRRVTLRKPGLLDSMSFEALFRRYLPDDRFEGLEQKLLVVATDLVAGRATVFHSGPLVLPLLASSSVPGMYSPMIIDGRWYVDGGVVDNFPVRLLKGRCDVIIGSHVSPLPQMKAADFDSALDVAQRALDIGMYAQAHDRFGECDVMVVPSDLREYGIFDSRHIPEMEAAGYAAAMAQMEAIRRAVS